MLAALPIRKKLVPDQHCHVYIEKHMDSAHHLNVASPNNHILVLPNLIFSADPMIDPSLSQSF